VRLRIDQEAKLVERLFDPEALAPDLCLRERIADSKIVSRNALCPTT
jgi:hypothetical protein